MIISGINIDTNSIVSGMGKSLEKPRQICSEERVVCCDVTDNPALGKYSEGFTL